MAAVATYAYVHGLAVSMYGRFGHGLAAESGVVCFSPVPSQAQLSTSRDLSPPDDTILPIAELIDRLSDIRTLNPGQSDSLRNDMRSGCICRNVIGADYQLKGLKHAACHSRVKESRHHQGRIQHKRCRCLRSRRIQTGHDQYVPIIVEIGDRKSVV